MNTDHHSVQLIALMEVLCAQMQIDYWQPELHYGVLKQFIIDEAVIQELVSHPASDWQQGVFLQNTPGTAMSARLGRVRKELLESGTVPLMQMYHQEPFRYLHLFSLSLQLSASLGRLQQLMSASLGGKMKAQPRTTQVFAEVIAKSGLTLTQALEFIRFQSTILLTALIDPIFSDVEEFEASTLARVQMSTLLYNTTLRIQQLQYSGQ